MPFIEALRQLLFSVGKVALIICILEQDVFVSYVLLLVNRTLSSSCFFEQLGNIISRFFLWQLETSLWFSSQFCALWFFCFLEIHSELCFFLPDFLVCGWFVCS